MTVNNRKNSGVGQEIFLARLFLNRYGEVPLLVRWEESLPYMANGETHEGLRSTTESEGRTGRGAVMGPWLGYMLNILRTWVYLAIVVLLYYESSCPA